MKTLASLMILSFCLVFPLAAQTDKNVEDEIPRSVNEATMIGIGGYNVMDTYLTPGIETKYTGWGVLTSPSSSRYGLSVYRAQSH